MAILESLHSLAALAVGDAYGEGHLHIIPGKKYEAVQGLYPNRRPWTDDSAMAQSVVSILYEYREIDQDELAREFARVFKMDPHRGYGNGAVRLLQSILAGKEWKETSQNLFGPNSGSYGNGSAMRAAPIGPFFGRNYERIVKEATFSAQVTHWHPDAEAGAVAVAIAAAAATYDDPIAYWDIILKFTPDGPVRSQIKKVSDIAELYCHYSESLSTKHQKVAGVFGNGSKVSCLDTVPFCLWAAADALEKGNFAEAMESIAEVGGDTDTNCAIVAGIIGNVVEPPTDWVLETEPLYRHLVAQLTHEL